LGQRGSEGRVGILGLSSTTGKYSSPLITSPFYGTQSEHPYLSLLPILTFLTTTDVAKSTVINVSTKSASGIADDHNAISTERALEWEPQGASHKNVIVSVLVSFRVQNSERSYF
jgi:hypothetical protein